MMRTLYWFDTYKYTTEERTRAPVGENQQSHWAEASVKWQPNYHFVTPMLQPIESPMATE